VSVDEATLLANLERGDYGPVLIEDPEDGHLRLGFYDDDHEECFECVESPPGPDDDCQHTDEAYLSYAIVYPLEFELGVSTHEILPYENMKRLPDVFDEASLEPVYLRPGDVWFYAVIVAPELAIGRVKLGVTKDLRDRLRVYRTSAPTAILIDAFGCARGAEDWLMRKIVRQAAGRLIGGEVYNFKDLGALFRAMRDAAAEEAKAP
jgi:hypothetical protein